MASFASFAVLLPRTLPDRLLPHAEGWVARVGLPLIVAGVLSVLLAYHVTLALVGAPPGTGLLVAANLLTVLGFAAGAGVMARWSVKRLARPIDALWYPIAVSGIALIAAVGVLALTGGAAGIDTERGLPSGMAGAVQVVGLGVIEGAVALALLLALRTLILFRRTRAAVRKWRWMLGFMIAAALVLLGTRPLDSPTDSVLHIILLVFAVVMMVVNGFRLSWIVYLSFRRKLGALGLSFGLLLLLVAFLGSRSSNGWIGAFVLGRDTVVLDLDAPVTALFSQPLSQFVTLTLVLGVLYCTTTLLVLLFHLPTAGAFEQKSGEMEALAALATLSGEVLDRDRLVDTVASAPVEAGLAEAAWLALVEPATGSLQPRIVAASGLTASQITALVDTSALVEDARQRHEPVLLPNAPADHRVQAQPGDGLGSLVVIPLRAHEEDLGALVAVRALTEGFEADDVAALQTFGAQAAYALGNAALFAERLERERLERELAIAREVQQRLLPQRLPSRPDLACAAVSLPAQEVAGDYYDVLDLGEGRFGFLVADVSGKGTQAAFYMAELKGIVQALAPIAKGPRDLLLRANDALAGSLGRAAFISATYAVLDTRCGTVTLARAGHCPTAHVTASDGSVAMLRSGGLGLGMARGTLFAGALVEASVPLAPGDTLVLYTDGLTESRNPEGDEYGYDRLAEALERHHALDPAALRDALLRDLRHFAHRPHPPAHDSWEDDLTLLVVRWTGTKQPAALSPDTTASPEALATA